MFALIRQGEVAAGAAPRLLADPARLDNLLTALAVPATTAHTAADRVGAHGAVPALSAPGARRVACVPEPCEEGLDHPRSAERGDRQRAGGDPAALAAVRPALSAEQIELVRRLLTSGDLVRPVIGAAGTGKTEAMRALTDVVTATGSQVFATAHGGRQAEELAARIGIPARVVTSWLTLLDHVDDPATVWPPGSVLIVDEATQVSTRHAERLLRHATRTSTVLILLEDPAQLGSVDAGG